MWAYLFIAPTMLGALIFSIWPVLNAFFMSVNDWDGLTDPRFIGIGNFLELAGDPLIAVEVRNTFVYAFCVVPITIVLAIVLANLLNAKIPARSFFRVLFFLPIVTMPTAVTTVWRWLFHSKLGLVNVLLRPFGLNPQWIGDTSWIMPALVIVAVWSGLGYATVICIAGLQAISRSYYEAAEMDGANVWYVFWHITVPLMSPTIFFLSITSLMNAFKAFDTVYMMLGAEGTASGPIADAIRTMVVGIFQRGFTFMRMGYAASEAVVLFAIIIAITGVQFLAQKKLVHYE